MTRSCGSGELVEDEDEDEDEEEEDEDRHPEPEPGGDPLRFNELELLSELWLVM